MPRPLKKYSPDKMQQTVAVKGFIESKYYIVSEDSLDQLGEYSDSSTSLDLSLFFFALTCGILITLCTCDIANKSLFALLLSAGSISFVLGIVKYVKHWRNKRKTISILKKIRKTRCHILQ